MGRSILFTAIDYYGGGFNIGKAAFRDLSGGVEGGTLDVDAVSVSPHPCPKRSINTFFVPRTVRVSSSIHVHTALEHFISCTFCLRKEIAKL
jgi:hypothetical protein